jgi:hypothetical protein
MIYQSWQENLMTGREGRSNDMKQKLARVINKTNRCSIKLAMFYSSPFLLLGKCNLKLTHDELKDGCIAAKYMY